MAFCLGSAVSAAPIERVQTDPTAWFWFYGEPPNELSAAAERNGARIVDLTVEQSNPLLFSAVMVANSGPYAKSWHWYDGLSADEVATRLDQTKSRIISISPYRTGGTVRYAMVTVANVGPDAQRSWWWADVDAGFIERQLRANGARLVELRRMAGAAQRYAVVMNAGSGADALPFWWYVNVTAADIGRSLRTNNAQLVVLDGESSNPSANLDAAMQGCPCGEWWYYFGQTPQLVGEELDQNGARLTMLRPTGPPSARTFTIAMVNNSDAYVTRMGNLIRANGHDGWYGFYLKAVNGPVIGAINSERRFEPASTIKILIAVDLMQRVERGQISLDKTTVSTYGSDPSKFCHDSKTGSESLRSALTQMLQNSDNARTKVLAELAGLRTLTPYARSIGLVKTEFKNYIDCEGPHNVFTLADAGRLYEGIVNGTLLNAAGSAELLGMMAGKTHDFSGMWSGVDTIVRQEAPAGLTARQLNAFEDAVRLSYKAGGYDYTAAGILDVNGEQRETIDVGIDGYASIPYCNGGARASHAFVFGFFAQEGLPYIKEDPDFAATRSGAEILREQIRAGLATWRSCSR
jgi:hypothetical protein